ncbi:MAG: metalloregulator ArsR/SmtB family transcription factor [Acidobacteria bacterium]|nr:metalloregulator ArsR/SmtB family transcription factor [Acidobacteriota bacterium]MCA1649198.1 metalloregulator ArsR/SmtB family transcription factor [Acidobacteriota bacterium]
MTRQRSKLEKMEGLFKALGDATRLRILGLLMTGEVCVCHIYQSLKIPQPKASRHLAYLRSAGLVETRRDGLWVHYRMAGLPDPVLKTISETVRHALTHMDVVHRDAERLQKKTGCCLPASDSRAGLACCEQQQEPARVNQ